jgi:glycine/D-amino acid oxidase-like deaminating enzyme
MTTADVVVVGGGIVGTATTAFLAEAGVHVVLCERGELAAGASGRNQGVVQHPHDPILADLYRGSLEAYQTLADEDVGFEFPDEPAGLLYVGHQPAVAAEMAAAWRGLHPATNAAVIAGADLRALEPSLAPELVACRLEVGYPVAPASGALAFASLAERYGAEIRLGTPVELVVDGDRVVGVRGRDAGISAPTVVVAAGPWSPRLVDPSGAWASIRPSWGVVVAVGLAEPPLHVLEEAEIAIEPDDVDSAADGTEAGPAIAFSLVTAGGTTGLGSVFADREPDPAPLVPRLVERGSRFVPALAAAPIFATRVCARPVSLDGRPLVGAVPGLDGVVLAAGHGPWGISTGPGTARLVADLVLGRERIVPTALDPGRFRLPSPVSVA